MDIRVADLFAGIGGLRLGFEQAFPGAQTVFASEVDKWAQRTYRANFTSPAVLAGDITKVPDAEIPGFDVLLAGFPCQAFSAAGRRQGFADDYYGVTRGTLFREVVRLCRLSRPKVVLCENVKNLIHHDRGRTFQVILSAFEECGYKVFWKVLRSSHFGVPQDRERVYMVGFRKDLAPDVFSFPEGVPGVGGVLGDVLDDAPVPARYYLSSGYLETLRRHRARHASRGNNFGMVVRALDGRAGTLVCGGMGRERNLVVDEREHSMVPTTNTKSPVNTESIRRLTPREWARLQGFPEDFALPLSDTHLYKQLGNTVTVPVVAAVATEVRRHLEQRLA